MTDNQRVKNIIIFSEKLVRVFTKNSAKICGIA